MSGRLPPTVYFEGLEMEGRKRWVRLDYRPPKKGEFYLSGAVVKAYRAPNDLTSSYIVVRPYSAINCKIT